MAKIPAFARASTLEVLETALNTETGALYELDRICYVYIDDGEKFVYIDPSKQIHLINGNNKVVVQKVDTLPSVSEADSEVLYINDNIVYLYDEQSNTYKPTFYEVAIQIDNLTTQLNTIESRVGNIETSISDIEDRITAFNNALDVIDTHLSSIDSSLLSLDNSKADKENVYTKSQVDALLEVSTPSGPMSFPEYVDTSVQEAVNSATEYTDQQLTIHFV